MFTIVVGHNPKKKLPILKRYRLTFVRQNGVSFSLLELKRKSLVKKQKVVNLIDKGRVVLFSDEIAPCESNTFNRVDESVYSLKLMQNGISLLLDKAKPIDKRLSVTLIDIRSRYQDIADILVSHFNTLRVITNRVELYQNYVDTKLYDCGATVIIEKYVRNISSNALFVSPDGIVFGCMINSNVPIISVSEIKNVNAPVIHSFRAKTPEKYYEIMPQGIDEHLYQAAIYNYCGIRSLSSLMPQTAIVNGTKNNINEIVLFQNQEIFK